jgi:hypothetical protein
VGVAVPVLTTDRLKEYVLQHVAVASAGGACPAIDQGYDLGQVDPLAVGPDLYGFELVYRCSGAPPTLLRDTVLFASVPNHVDFATIRTHGQVVEQLFSSGRQQLVLPDAGVPPPAGLLAYVRIGLVHVLGSFDRWCVLLGALLLVRRRGDVGGVILALAGGYLLSLALSASGWVLPRVSAVEAFIGLLVALLGTVSALRDGQYRKVGILGWASLLVLLAVVAGFVHAPWAALVLLGGAFLSAGILVVADRTVRQGAGWWLLLALFACLDGVVMAAVLPPAQLPQRSLLQVMLGFDAGAWLIESLLVAAIAAVLLVAGARRIVAARTLLDDLLAAGLSGLGTFWLLSRLWV